MFSVFIAVLTVLAVFTAVAAVARVVGKITHAYTRNVRCAVFALKSFLIGYTRATALDASYLSTFKPACDRRGWLQLIRSMLHTDGMFQGEDDEKAVEQDLFSVEVRGRGMVTLREGCCARCQG